VARGDQIDAFAIRSGGDNSLQQWPAGSCPSTPWQNWAANQSVPNPVAHYHPSSLEEVVVIVLQAESRGKRVRAVGSSWSFSDIAMTGDYVVETHLLNRVLTNVINANPPVLTVRERKLLHVEAGITIEEFNRILDDRGWAVPTTMGASGANACSCFFWVQTELISRNINNRPVCPAYPRRTPVRCYTVA
jgi:FAD/FMN-containing dehydrogenase